MLHLDSNPISIKHLVAEIWTILWKFKNNVKHKNLSPLLACYSKIKNTRHLTHSPWSFHKYKETIQKIVHALFLHSDHFSHEPQTAQNDCAHLLWKLYQSQLFSGIEHIFCWLWVTMLEIQLFCWSKSTKYFETKLACFSPQVELHEYLVYIFFCISLW